MFFHLDDRLLKPFLVIFRNIENKGLVGEVIQVADIIRSEPFDAIAQKLLQLILVHFLPLGRKDISDKTRRVRLHRHLLDPLPHATHFGNGKGQRSLCSLFGNQLLCHVLEVISNTIIQIANPREYFLGLCLEDVDLLGLGDVPEAN